MILALLASHLVAIVASAIAGRRSMRAGLAVAAIVPAVTAIWAAGLLISNPATTPTGAFTWVEGLALSFRFRADALGLMMTLLVSGIGALVFIYAIGYFSSSAAGGSRFPASLLAFSASMLGLVLADSVWTLFIFWEFTSVTSFLLVGHKNSDATVLAAARRALMITGGGGLALLAGMLILADQAGTTVISDFGSIGAEGSSGAAALAAVLIMVGAATKSAQVPFHVWLPGAMAAPTPVSAYLHSATMVKAGVLLVAVVGGAFADTSSWKTLGLAFGITSMIWGAVGALRHVDAKLILAWGTVSQLGLLITLLSLGTAKATFAAVSILFAHALFKAALFLTVGEIDIRTGTRDINHLNGLARSMPVTFAVALAAGLSMAGVPPLLGFAAKEAAIEAVLGLTGAEAAIAGSGIIGGSVLTVAYTTRFLLTVFGTTPHQTSGLTKVAPQRLAMTIPAVLLSGAGLLGFIAMGQANQIVRPVAIELDQKAEVYELLRWPGLTTGLIVSFAVVAAGAGLGYILARRTEAAPEPTGARLADEMLDGVLSIARRLTAKVQHGSLPVYLATMAATAVLATIPFLTDLSWDHLVWWDSPVQAVLAVAIVASAVAGTAVGSRLGAALTLGAVGFGVSGIFITHGAPDLALTQLLVETIVVVGFVIGLGHLANRFPPVENTWRMVRLTISVLGGVVVMLALVSASANPVGRAPAELLATAAVDDGGGNNVVNVILTDVRALDTLGEVVVLATVAVGILALSTAGRSTTGRYSGGRYSPAQALAVRDTALAVRDTALAIKDTALAAEDTATSGNGEGA